MNLVRAASRRWALRHPGQVVLSVLGVALGVAVVVAIDLAIQSSRAAFEVSTETVAGRATHRIEGGPSGLPDSVFTRVRTELGLRASAPVVEAWAASERWEGTALRLLGVDPFSERPFRPYLAGGGPGLDVDVLLNDPAAVVLPEALALDGGLEVGDSLALVVEGRSRVAVVAGTLTAADELARRGLADVIVADVATVQRFLDRPGRLTRIDLVLSEEPAAEAAVLAELDRIVPAGARVLTVGTRSDSLSGMLRAFDLNLTALSLLALVFGMFLIYNAMTFSVVQRRELLGSLRALGVTRGEVTRMIGMEALATGVVGTTLGLGFGVVLGRGLVRLVTQTINDLYFSVTVESLTLPPEVLAKGTLLGVGATLLAAWPAVREAVQAPPRMAQTRSLGEDRVRRLVPRAAVSGGGLVAGGVVLLTIPSRSLLLSFAGLFAVLLGAALLTPLATVVFVRAVLPLLGATVGILGTLAARGVTAALSRTAPAVAALVVAVSVTVGLGVMIQSFRGTVVEWLDHTLQADIYVSPPSPISSRAEGALDPGVVERLSAVPGIAGRSTYRGTELLTDDGLLRVVALDLDPRGEASFRFLDVEAADAFGAFRGAGAVLVSEPYAYRNGVEAGDRIELLTDRGPTPLEVAGVFKDYGSERGVVMMARTTWSQLYDDDRITSLGFFLADGVDTDEVEAAMRSAAGADQAVVVRSNRALREASLEVFDRTFAITAVLRALAFGVAFIGVLSALMALQLERGRELGVLRANGLTPRQVWTLVTTQTGVLGLVAGLLAVPTGLALAVIMIEVVNRRSFGWTLDMQVGGGLLLQAVGLAMAGALLAGLYPAWRMSRTSPALALREE
ncbi:MAG: FtsX-like permease family protein [Gemmatimonadetes bacterium]|nr:FtsX-like permease family protein [Gemmatimonadota bacterium]NNK64971.1 FtsX-like permease family protein [Gemmatimonadota bacterium]